MELKEILARIDPSKLSEVMAAFKNCKNAEDAKAVVVKFGLPITDDELAFIGKKFTEGGSELSDELLGNVVGGTVGPTITQGCW